MADLTITLAIQTHDRAAGLRRVVDAALADDADEVLVLVNGCTQGSAPRLAPLAAADRRLRIVESERTLLDPARERLVREAGGDVVLLLDDDVLAEPGLAAGHRAAHAADAGLVVQGYMPVAEEALRASGLPAELYSMWYEAQVPGWEADGDNVLRGLWGGNVSIRREDALRVPPNNPAFPARTNQDREWGLRLLKAGLRGRFDRRLRAQHLYARSVPQFLRYQRNTGAGSWHVHALHHDVIGHLPQDNYFRHLARSQQRLVRLARRPRSGPAIAAAGGLAAAVHRVPLPEGVRRTALVLALTMAQQRAALDASLGR